MHPSQSFLTDARTFMPRACVCWCKRVEAPSIRGTGRRALRVLGMEVNERAIAGAVRAVRRTRRRALEAAKDMVSAGL